MSLQRTKLDSEFTLKVKELSASIEKAFNKVVLSLSTLAKFMSPGDGTTEKILLRRS